MVSIKYLFEVAEFSCVNRTPRPAVTSLNCTSSVATLARPNSNAAQTIVSGAEGDWRRITELREAPPADDAFAFLDHEQMVRRQILERLLRARRPRHFHRVRFVGATQAEMEPQIVLRIVARPAHHLICLHVGFCRDFHARPDCRSVRARADALDQN